MMADRTPSTKTNGSGGRWLRLALILSVALNLAVAGVVAGAWLRAGPGERRAPDAAVRDLGFGPFAGALSEEDRRALRRAYLQRSPDLREVRRQMRADMAGVLAALRAEPFAPDALQSALRDAGARTAERLELGQSLLLERIEAMTPEARRAFADRLEAGLTRRGGPPAEGGASPRP